MTDRTGNQFRNILTYLASHGMGRALRHRDFALYSAAGWISNIGFWVQRIGVQWLVWKLTGSYAVLGGIAFAEAVAILTVMPIAGTLTDRFDRLALARISQIGATLVALLFATFTLLDLINVPLLFAFMILSGLIDGLWTPVRMAMPPNLVPREDMTAALGVGAMLFNLAQFVGPAVAALFIWAFGQNNTGIGIAFAFNSLTFFSYLVVLYIIKLRSQEHQSNPSGGYFSDFTDGLIYLFQKPGLKLFLLLMLFTALCLRPFRELLAGIADGKFGQGFDGVTILIAATGLGAFFGGLAVANFGRVAGMTRIMIISFGIDIVLQILFAMTGNFWIATAAGAAMGFVLTVAGIGSQILIQSTIHGVMRGRVMSIWGMIQRGGPPIGAWLVGLGAGVTGLENAFLIATGIFLLIWLFAVYHCDYLARVIEITPDESQP